MSHINNPYKSECIAVGKYARMADPEMVDRLKEDGYNTSNENIGLYILDCDPDMFDMIIGHDDEA